MSAEDTSRRLRFGGGTSSSLSAAARKKEQIYGIFADDVDEDDYAERRPGFLQDSSSDEEANGDGRRRGRKTRVGTRIEFVRGGVWKPEEPAGEGKRVEEGSVGLKKKKKARPAVERVVDDQEEHEEELGTREDEAASVVPSLHEQLLNAQVLKEVLGDAYASSEEDEEGSEKTGTKEEADNERQGDGKSASEGKDAGTGPQPSDQQENSKPGRDGRENSLPSEPQKKRLKTEEAEADDSSSSSSEDDSSYASVQRFKFTEVHAGKGTGGGGLEGRQDRGGPESPIVPEKNTWGFAKMERTYGVGFKLLKKMGFKGGGLGRHGTGVANPLEVRVREKNRGLQVSLSGASRLPRVVVLLLLTAYLPVSDCCRYPRPCSSSRPSLRTGICIWRGL